MQRSPGKRRVVWASIALISLAAALFATFTVVNSAKAAVPFVGHKIGVHPNAVRIEKDSPNVTTFGCQFNRPGRLRCFSPAQIRRAYGIQSILDKGTTGAGHTIVIVDAFSAPTINQDLALFDSSFGLPAPPSFTQISPVGSVPFDFNDGNMLGWSAEISLDVEWSHAVAPGANIILALAKTNDDVDIFNTTKFVVDHNLGDVISMSFGEGESCVDPALRIAQHNLFKAASKKHITLMASSGDQGAAQPTCDGTDFFKSVSNPASDPFVTAVGGTNLFAIPVGCLVAGLPVPCSPADTGVPGTYQSETAWNDAPLLGDTAHGFSGGGFSTIYKQPGYQQDALEDTSHFRGVPDVAYDAGVNGGVIAFWGDQFGVGAAFIFGGTSAGAPQWSGLTVLANQMAGKRLGFLNKALYQILGEKDQYSANFHDITVGNNTFAGNTGDIPGFNAVKGWDAVTGIGTPKANTLIPQLVGKGDNDGSGEK